MIKEQTIILFKKTDKNRKCGVYSEYLWNSNSGCELYKNNSNIKYFIFNISDKKKYLPKKIKLYVKGDIKMYGFVIHWE